MNLTEIYAFFYNYDPKKFGNIDVDLILSDCKFNKPLLSNEIEKKLSELSYLVPYKYRQFLNLTNGCQLFIDKQYGQWGLNLYSVDDIKKKNQEWFASYRGKEFLFGDLIIGEFLGDSDLVILRCDNTQNDYENIIISLPLDAREDWFYLNTFSDFCEKFIEYKGEKFWENKLS